MVQILVLDNYDSFVYTLNGYLQQLGAQTEVVRNDAVTEAELPALLARFDAVLISPGPGTPADAGLSIPTVKFALENNYPVFGVCLGHQAIAEAAGNSVLIDAQRPSSKAGGAATAAAQQVCASARTIAKQAAAGPAAKSH
jgi:para-aminobenzoate synthetase component 2